MTYLPTAYEQFIYKSRYSRWLPEENRREEWEETVARYFDFFDKRLKKENNFTLTKELRAELEQAVLNLEVMPSMRALMTAGPALERCNVAGFNCFSGSTQYMTKEGLKTFKETANTTQTILSGTGNWVEARIHEYGVQKLNRVTLKSSKKTNVRRFILATADHKWITARGETTALEVGDVIPFQSAPYEFDLEQYIAGIGFGDGTLDTRGRARIRLCGAKNKLLPYFEEYGNSSIMYPPSYEGDALVVFHKGFFENWKELPKTPSASWFEGYLAADGHSNPVQPGVLTQSGDVAKYIYDNSAYAGLLCTGMHTYMYAPTSVKNTTPLHRLSLHDTGSFYVESIEENVAEETVYCALEPTTSSFTLAGGVVTGNCSYLPIDHLRAFDECLYVLMCGTGVGFSVEKSNTDKLPTVNEHFEKSSTVIVVEDSKQGWAKGLRELIALLYSGQIPTWDLSKLRPAGARLKTFGGRSSGPEPLNELFAFVVQKIIAAKGRKLTPLECHDIVCKIADVVVVGGVRRSALISLSDLSDHAMQEAKSGMWWENNKQRALANNSVAYTSKPDLLTFIKEWEALIRSQSGERGIFNREASAKFAKRFGRRDPDQPWGTNPCAEITLRPYQFCNLTEVVVRSDDTFESLKRKARIASILGTFQSTLTDFKYLRKVWTTNTEEERLLGVSLTGILDNAFMAGKAKDDTHTLESFLEELRLVVVDANADFAAKLGISASCSTTCVKPSGTVSQLVNSASGIHTRHSKYYIRTVRGDKKDPLTQFLIAKGVPYEDCVRSPDTTAVFSFPMKAPESALVREDLTAIEHLELWKTYQLYWCEHKPSITVSVTDAEWLDVGAWVYKNFDDVSGVSFLPFSEHTYKQAPYQECDEATYLEYKARVPENIDWKALSDFEKEDTTSGTQTMACTGGVCEIVDIT
jgi:ribonucleoside-diphosphate reductase alpha chain